MSSCNRELSPLTNYQLAKSHSSGIKIFKTNTNENTQGSHFIDDRNSNQKRSKWRGVQAPHIEYLYIYIYRHNTKVPSILLNVLLELEMLELSSYLSHEGCMTPTPTTQQQQHHHHGPVENHFFPGVSTHPG